MKRLLVCFAAFLLAIGAFAQNIDISQIANSEQSENLDRVFRNYLAPENLTQAAKKNDYDSVKYFLKNNPKPEDFSIGYKYNGVIYRTYLYCISSGPVKNLLTLKGAVPLFCPPMTKNLKNYILKPQANSLIEYDETNLTPRVLLSKNQLLSYIEQGIISPDKIYKSFSNSIIYEEDDTTQNKYDLRYKYKPQGLAVDFIAFIGDIKYLSLLKQANIQLSFEEFAQIEPQLEIFLSKENIHYCKWLSQVSAPKHISNKTWAKYVEKVFCNDEQNTDLFNQKCSYQCINYSHNGRINYILNNKYRHNIIHHIYLLTTRDGYADNPAETIISDYKNIVSQRNGKENPYEKAIYQNTLAITREYINNRNQK